MYKNCKVKFLLPSREIWDAYSVIELQKLPLALNLQCSSHALFDNMDILLNRFYMIKFHQSGLCGLLQNPHDGFLVLVFPYYQFQNSIYTYHSLAHFSS